MTRDELIELARRTTTTNLPTAGRAIGLGANATYDANKRGELPFRVLKLGRKLRVPTSDLLDVLGIRLDDEAEPREVALPATQ